MKMKHLSNNLDRVNFSDYDPWSRPNPGKGKGGKSSDSSADSEEGKRRRPEQRAKGSKPAEDLADLIMSIFGAILGGGRKSDKKPRNFFSFGTIGGIAALLVLVWGIMGIYLVDEQERGVVLRFGKYYSILTPGLRWQPYLIDRVIVLNVTQVRSFSSRGIMLTEDENIVDITINVQYVIDEPRDFVINTRDPELSLRQATDSSLRHVVGSTIMDRVITEGRAEVALSTQERIQRYLDNYGTGIAVSQVSIQRADPPEQVKASFEDVISAREDKVRFINQATAYSNAIIPQARGEAQRILEEGEGYKRDKIARAEGQAQRFDLVYDEYVLAPDITKRRLYIEAMEEILANSNKILLDVSEGNNNLLYLPLDRLLNQAGGTANLPQPSSAVPNSAIPPSSQVNDIVRRVMEEINNQRPRGR